MNEYFLMNFYAYREHSSSNLSLGLIISLITLLFTGFNFWYVMERRGKLRIYDPSSFAYAEIHPSSLLIRLPLLFEATGAKPKVVRSLRVTLSEFPGASPLLWSSIRESVQPTPNEINDVPAPFGLPGRTILQTFIEFQGEFAGFGPNRSNLRINVEGLVGTNNHWLKISSHTLSTKNITNPGQFLSYRINHPDKS